MKKLLIALLIAFCDIGRAQDCLTDVPRIASYEHMEVYNWTTEQYEKYTKTKTVYIQVIIRPEKKTIVFEDTVNSFGCVFQIKDCMMTSKSMEYDCYDVKNKKDCKLLFTATPDMYVMTVKYQGIMYRTKQYK